MTSRRRPARRPAKPPGSHLLWLPLPYVLAPKRFVHIYLAQPTTAETGFTQFRCGRVHTPNERQRGPPPPTQVLLARILPLAIGSGSARSMARVPYWLAQLTNR